MQAHLQSPYKFRHLLLSLIVMAPRRGWSPAALICMQPVSHRTQIKTSPIIHRLERARDCSARSPRMHGNKGPTARHSINQRYLSAQNDLHFIVNRVHMKIEIVFYCSRAAMWIYWSRLAATLTFVYLLILLGIELQLECEKARWNSSWRKFTAPGRSKRVITSVLIASDLSALRAAT